MISPKREQAAVVILRAAKDPASFRLQQHLPFMFLPRLGGGVGVIADGGGEPQSKCLQVSDHDLKSERAAALLSPSAPDYGGTSPGTGEGLQASEYISAEKTLASRTAGFRIGARSFWAIWVLAPKCAYALRTTR
jgi:hypothetical protein